jgi:hypothetical protein
LTTSKGQVITAPAVPLMPPAKKETQKEGEPLELSIDWQGVPCKGSQRGKIAYAKEWIQISLSRKYNFQLKCAIWRKLIEMNKFLLSKFTYCRFLRSWDPFECCFIKEQFCFYFYLSITKCLFKSFFFASFSNALSFHLHSGKGASSQIQLPQFPQPRQPFSMKFPEFCSIPLQIVQV